jgi:DNA-binding MurR/RpiR family transcriptional regulator
VNPRGIVSDDDKRRITAARAQAETAEAEYHAIVVEVTARSSIRETAKAAGVSPDTIVRWRRDN